MEQIVDFNIYNYSINEMEKLCELKYNYTFSDISLQAQKTKKACRVIESNPDAKNYPSKTLCYAHIY